MVGVGEMSMIIDVCEVIITDEGCATLDSRAQPEILIGGEGKIFTKIMKFSKMVNYASENWACRPFPDWLKTMCNCFRQSFDFSTIEQNGGGAGTEDR